MADGNPEWDKFPSTVQLHFRSDADRQSFMAGLSDGWGENHVCLDWPWAGLPATARSEAWERQTQFAVTLMDD